MVRLLTVADIPQAMELKRAAGWNQTELDWARLIELAPDGCFAMECNGVVASTAVALPYGDDLAWIGMVLTSPDFRGRGLAKALMEHCVHYLDSRGVRCIKLDATDMGRDLYRKLGFEDECAVERWRREPGPVPFVVEAKLKNGLHAYSSGCSTGLDAFCGADRTLLLDSLAQFDAVSIPDVGFAMGRPGTLASYFGPCISRTSEGARQFVQWYVSRHWGEAIFWDLFPENGPAVRLAEEYGFSCRRKLVRMARPGPGGGPIPRTDCTSTYALAGFEYG